MTKKKKIEQKQNKKSRNFLHLYIIRKDNKNKNKSRTKKQKKKEKKGDKGVLRMLYWLFSCFVLLGISDTYSNFYVYEKKIEQKQTKR
jgi:hypothetical protein